MKSNFTKSLVALLLVGMTSVMAYAQDITIKGSVKDQTGEAVIGAAIKVQNTTKGTATDANGNFTISAPSNGALEISYLVMPHRLSR